MSGESPDKSDRERVSSEKTSEDPGRVPQDEKVPEDENEKAGKPAEGDGREGAADAGAEGIAEASPGDAEDETEDAQGASQAPGEATTVLRVPESPEDEDGAAGDRDDRLTTELRVPPAEVREAEEAAEEAGEAGEVEEAGEAGEAEGDDTSADGGDHATTMLRVPAERPEGDGEAGEGDQREDAEAETLVTAAPGVEPDGDAGAPDEGGKGDRGGDADATAMLRLPASAKGEPAEPDAPDEPRSESADDAEESGETRAPGKASEAKDAKDATDAKEVDEPTEADGAKGSEESEAGEASGKPDVTAVLPAPGDVPPKPPAPPTPPREPAKPAAAPDVPPPPTEAPPPADSQRDPLELLAALTNRPPPSPTPLRTALRRVKIWTPLVVLLLVVFVVAQSLRPLPDPELRLTGAQAHTLAGELDSVPWPATGQARVDVVGLGTLGSSGEEEPVPIASVAKVMTAYVILRDHPMEAEEELGEMIPVDQQAEDDAALSEENESIVEVTAGTELSQREALQAVMIASANNVARLLARWDAGSEEAFVAKMNEAAAELGMENTTYTDPSGLRSETVSTAADQVRLAKAVMEDPVFREVARMPSYEDSEGRLHYNWNHLVSVNGVIGIKTGTTTSAGGNLMFAAEQEVGGTTQLIVGAVLAQPPHPSDNSILTGALTASDELIRFTQGQLTDEPLFAAGDTVGEVDDGLGGSVPVVVTEDVPVVGWPGLEVRLALTAAGDGVPGSAEAGTVVGTLSVGGGAGAVEVPVALADDLAEPGFGTRLTRIG